MLLKALVHALILCALLNLTSPHVTGAGFRLVLDALSPGAFTIVSASFAAGLHGLRALALVVLVIACLAAFPAGLQDLARLTTPVGIGVLLGHACRSTITEQREDRGS